ncbi:MAG: hypothetical protein ACK5OX_06470 [Desertimonas sp.]
MTALPRVRRRSTWIVLGASVVALAAIVGLVAAGAQALWTSTDGSKVDVGPPELTFPATPTVLLVGVDDTGQPASLSVLVARPDGRGANVVIAPVSIDASLGEGTERMPVAVTATRDGLDALALEVSIALGVSFDAVELADRARLTELLAPFGVATVTVPFDVTDSSGELVAAAGTAELDAAAMAAVLTARDRSIPAAEQTLAAVAVWEGIAADARGDSTAAPVAADVAVTVASTLEAAAAGPIGTWAIRSRPVDARSNPEALDVVIPDRVESALVFGQIAPGHVSAANPSASFRLIAAYTDEQLGERGWTNADVAYQAISQVLYLRGNVLSVDTTIDEAPEVTRVEIMQPGLNVDGMDVLFGTIEHVDVDERIVGIDAVLVLGEGYLEFLDAVVDRGLVTVGSSTVDTAGDGN